MTAAVGPELGETAHALSLPSAAAAAAPAVKREATMP